jgi:hypothetical protein
MTNRQTAGVELGKFNHASREVIVVNAEGSVLLGHYPASLIIGFFLYS